MSLILGIYFLVYFTKVLTYNGLGKTKKRSFITDVSRSTIYRLVYIRVYKTESKSMGERISWGKY